MAGIVFEVGPVAVSEWVDGALKIGVDQQGEEGTGRTLESLQPLGLFARPNDPTTNELGEVQTAAGALYGNKGDDQFVMPLGDPALIGRIPQGSKGSTTIYNGTGAFLSLGGGVEKGSTMLYVPYVQDDADKSMALSIDVQTAGSQNVQLIHGEGHSFKMLATGEVMLTNRGGDAYLQVDDDGVKIAGNTTIVGGVVVGNAPTAQQLPLGPDLMTWIGQVNAALGALNAVGGAPTAGANFPAVIVPTAVPILTTLLSASPTP